MDLRVIFKGEEVALHTIGQETGNYVTKRSHLPDYKVYSQTEYQARFEAQFADMGESAHRYVRYLLEQKEPYWSRIARSILGLQKQFGDEVVCAALKRALYYNVRDTVTIKNIVEKKLYLHDTEPKLRKVAESESSFTREMDYYSTNL